MHRLYQRYVRRTTKFHAHDEENQCQVGDRVRDRVDAAAVEDQALAGARGR